MLRILLVGAMLLMTTVNFATAEDKKKGFLSKYQENGVKTAYVKVYGGISRSSFSESYNQAGGDNSQVAANNNGRVESKKKPSFSGAAIGYYFTDDGSLSLELASEKITTDFQTLGTLDATGRASTDAVFLNYYIQPDPKNNWVYLGMGVGGGDFEFDKEITVTETDANDVETKRPATAEERKRIIDSVDDASAGVQFISGFNAPLGWIIPGTYLDVNARYLIIGGIEITTYSAGLRVDF